MRVLTYVPFAARAEKIMGIITWFFSAYSGWNRSPCNRHFHFKRISFRARVEIRHVIREASPGQQTRCDFIVLYRTCDSLDLKMLESIVSALPSDSFSSTLLKIFFFYLKRSKNNARKLKRNMRVSKIKATDTGNVSIVPVTGTKDPLFQQPMRLWLAH